MWRRCYVLLLILIHLIVLTFPLELFVYLAIYCLSFFIRFLVLPIDIDISKKTTLNPPAQKWADRLQIAYMCTSVFPTVGMAPTDLTTWPIT